MTEQLHRLIDSGAQQPVINERVAGLIEGNKSNIAGLIENSKGQIAELKKSLCDHEKRIRYLERTMAWGLGGIAVISSGMVIVLKIWK